MLLGVEGMVISKAAEKIVDRISNFIRQQTGGHRLLGFSPAAGCQVCRPVLPHNDYS